MKKLFTLVALSIIGLVFNTKFGGDEHENEWVTTGSSIAHADAPPSSESSGSSSSSDG